MPHHPRQIPLFGPAAVAVHDHRHVGGQAGGVQQLRQGGQRLPRRLDQVGGRQGATHARDSGVSWVTLRPVGSDTTEPWPGLAGGFGVGRARAALSSSRRRLLVIGLSSLP